MENVRVGAGTGLVRAAVGGAIGGVIGTAAAYYGLGLLQGTDANGQSRAAVAVTVGLACAVAFGLVARAGAVASAATADWDLEELAAIRKHARHTQLAIAGGVVLGIGAIFAAIVGFVFVYAQMNEGLSEWHPDYHVLGMGELFVSGLFGLIVGVIAQRVLRPGLISEPAHASDRPINTADDAELLAITARVRTARRRELAARVVSVVTFLVVGAAAWWAGTSLGLGTLALSGGGALAIFGAVLVHRLLRSPVSVSDIVDGIDGAHVEAKPATESAPTYEKVLTEAEELTVHRKISVASYLGLAPSAYTVLASYDHVCAAERAPYGWQLLLPARWRALTVELRDDDRKVATIDAGVLGWSLTVRGANGALLGVVESSIFGRSYRVRPADGRAVDVRGSWFFRRVFHVVRDGERIGGMSVRNGWPGILALLFGIERAIDSELPRDATLSERTMLLGALLWIDQRHF